jgi:hypothetical protein
MAKQVPFFLPTSQADERKIQRQMMMAQMLMSQQRPQREQTRIVPREDMAVNLLPALTQAAGMFMQNKAMQGEDALKAKEYAALLQAMGGGSSGPMAPTEKMGQMQSQGQMTPGIAPPQSDPGVDGGQPQTSSMNPFGLDPQLAAHAYQLDPAKYMGEVLSANKPEDRPNSVREYEYAKANGYKGTYDEWQRIGTVQAKDPASIQEYNLAKSQGYKGTFEQWIGDRAQATVTMPFVPMTVGGVPGFGNRQSGGFTPTSSLPEETDAAARLKEAEARAAELAKAQAGRDATFQEDLNVIDDEILRTQRLLSEFKAGKYQTGPLAGRLPNVRTAAQDLSREQGKDTIKAISSATFGALSEGERGFLKELGVSETANEESNINMLERRLEELQRTKRRLNTRERLGVGPTTAPAQQGSPSRPPLSSFQK